MNYKKIVRYVKSHHGLYPIQFLNYILVKMLDYLVQYFASILNFLETKMRSSNPVENNNMVYKQLIDINGFGHSGSGVLIDFFSEFESMTVYGGNDPSSAQTSPNDGDKSIEIDVFRHFGGVFFLENIIELDNVFIKDAAMKQFIASAEYWHKIGGPYNDKYMELTDAFISRLVLFKLPSSYGFEYCPELRHYPPLSKQRCIYYLRKMKKEEYIAVASQYIKAFLQTIPSKEYLVMDHIIGDGNPDLDYHLKYFGNIKQLSVYRDPRDVYVTGINVAAAWIPKVPEEFIVWYKYQVSSFLTYRHEDALILRFEDLVLKYDDTTKKVMNFVGLSPNQHKYKKAWFDPSRSSKNIGIWKSYPDQIAISKISNALSEYCYDGQLEN